MAFGLYISKIRGLMELKRYQNMFRFKERSVAEHQWSVSQIAYGLANWETKKFGNKVDYGKLLKTTLSHDNIEVFTGDILSMTKRTTKNMEKAIGEVEKIRFEEEYKPMLPKSWVEETRAMVLNPKDNSIEGKIIAASDIIDTILESVEEIELGNLPFKPILISSTEKLVTIDLESVRYFLKYSINDFGLDIKEYYGEKTYEYIQGLVI